MYVPNAEVIGQLPNAQEATLFWARFLRVLIVPSYTLLLLALLVFNFKTIYKNRLVFHPFIKYVSLLSVLSNIYLLLSSIYKYFFQQSFPLINIPSTILFIVFPIVFAVHLAWKNEIALYIRYFIIVSYFAVLLASIIMSIPFIFEQIIFRGKFCLGYSCPPTSHPVILAPEQYLDLIHK
jgi:hypothetical protein